MAFTVKCTPLYPGGRPPAPRAKSPEVDLLQDRNANYQEFVDLMRQVPNDYWDPQLSPYLAMETAIQDPAAFSEALNDSNSSDYLFDLSDHFDQPEHVQDDFFTAPLPMLDDSMEIDQTDTSLDSVDPAELFDWDSLPEDWMLNANISPDALAELNDLLSSMEDFLPKQNYHEQSIEELTRHYLGELPEIVLSPTTDESSERL